jgi:REP element-mobilizing transposase RayT
VIDYIRAGVERSDVQPVAYAVMPNHLHLLIVQGNKELSAFLQPLLRRVALLVLRHHKREGHVFERRYHAVMCRDPEYYHNALVYIHLNPVRARLCADPAEDALTSHRAFMRSSDIGDARVRLMTQSALRAFSGQGGDCVEQWCADYAEYVRWRRRVDACSDDLDRRASVEADRPSTAAGDRFWYEEYGAALAGEPPLRGKRIDLRDLVKSALAQIAPDMPLDQLRSGGRTRPLVAVRREVILRAVVAGHRTGQIADFLNVSTPVVSSALRVR